MHNSEEITDFLNRYLITVSKPGRYVGAEFNQVKKDWKNTELHVALAFPDVYEIGLPNLGMAILYDSINQREDALAERVYCPWSDMQDLLRLHKMPLFTLESKQPLGIFDLIGFSLPYETLYSNFLSMLDLAGIPLRSEHRTDTHPLIIAGGHACFNPEPMYAFVDAFVIGEGEEIIHEILDTLAIQKQTGANRIDRLRALSEIEGIYIPSEFQVTYSETGQIAAISPAKGHEKTVISKRFSRKLPPPLTRFLVPNIRTINERAVIEIMRGCSRGCRFCQAGMINRPVRERPRTEIIQALKEAVENSGLEEISLLSLSSSDHSEISGLIQDVMQLTITQQVSFSLPSLRVETFNPELISSMRGKRKGNFTIAPEAGSERMRQRINKPIPSDDIIETISQIFHMGWTNLKLYFMIGFPEESIEDVNAIVDLCLQIKSIGKKILGGKLKLHVSVNTLIPKAHTPFQWLPFSLPEQSLEKYKLISQGLRKSGIKVDWPRYENALLEAWLSRGDRRLAQVIERAWQKGANFDAWQECFQFEAWREAFTEVGIDADFYAYRPRSSDEVLPWDHIHTGVTKKFLLRENTNSLSLETSEDCREKCHACGIQSQFNILCEELRVS